MKRAERTADELVRYARERLGDLATTEVVAVELAELGCDKRRTRTYVDRALEQIRRALDAEDIQTIREGYLSSCADRALTSRKRSAALVRQLEEIEEIEIPDSGPERFEALNARTRLLLAVERTLIGHATLVDRSQRNAIVALVPREARQDQADPTDGQIDAAILKALDAPRDTEV